MSDATPELGELRAAVREFLADKSDERAIRAVIETPARHDLAVWRQLADQLGLCGLAIPERYGGDGFGSAELGVVLEEMGAALAPTPFFATVALAARALLESGDKDACARYLPGIAAGETTATLAASEGGASWDPALISTRARLDGGGWRLTGEKSFVIDGATADLLLVVARTTAGPTLFAAERGAPGLTATAMETLDLTRSLATLRLDQAPAELIGEPGQGGALLTRVLDHVCVALAAEQAGGARRCLETAAEYARTRYQFGRPIGSFQAVKHRCADMLVRVELAEASAREAARLADEGAPEFAAAAAAAHICCSRAFVFAATENIQVHGGIGFTWEHPAHLYFRRAKSSELLLGGPAVYHERLLERLGL